MNSQTLLYGVPVSLLNHSYRKWKLIFLQRDGAKGKLEAHNHRTALSMFL